jgi:hypothetical protein
MTASSVWEKLNHTNMCREYTAVKINAWVTRRRPVAGSQTRPILPKSIWHSTPGSPSATRTVVPPPPPNPQHCTQNRCSVRYETTTPRRASRSPIFTTVRSLPTHAVIRSCSACSSAHADPCPAGRTGRTAATT